MNAFDDLPVHSPTRRRIEGLGTDETTWHASPTLSDLLLCDVADWAQRYRRIWVLTPHPDDEVFALGGSLAQLSALHADVCIVAVTDGEGHHSDATGSSLRRTAQLRTLELQRGLAVLEVDAEVIRLGLPDGRIGAHRQDLLQALIERVVERDLLLATCRFDGEPDHEACGDVAALVSELTGATVFEYPVWMWHWASPGEIVVPWSRAHRIALAVETRIRKRDAIQQFASQLAPYDREPPMPVAALARFLRSFEVVFT